MWKQLFQKWFGLPPDSCESCEVLRQQLTESNAERKDLLHRLLDRDKPEPLQSEKEELKPITPQYTPWRVRQQMLEQEDRAKARIMKEKAKEIEDLENELGVK